MNVKYLFLLLLVLSLVVFSSCTSVLLDATVDSESVNSARLALFNESFSTFASLSPNDFSRVANLDDVIVIDVRQEIELRELGYIPQKDLESDFYSVDFTSFIDSLDKTKKYAIYCYHDTRSGKVMSYMKEQGFEFVVDLDGGIDAWLNEGLPVEFPPSSAFN